MKEEVVRSKDVFKNCFFVGCFGILIFVLAALAYLFLWPYG
ncbi:hypothetical protein [Pseudozobellia thermophila]|uniref:Uncharacterized protein n=1 Tax=Pseudozobellia thermophila TaxID=192903 RepID=A0A1M6BB39_9FLAO|nr:hypothetical protein [Pseudozobellia thermophila]SHI45960.1 hypothetical protein SAMN04488513_101352 [Pseudozobellia thermophila]